MVPTREEGHHRLIYLALIMSEQIERSKVNPGLAASQHTPMSDGFFQEGPDESVTAGTASMRVQ